MTRISRESPSNRAPRPVVWLMFVWLALYSFSNILPLQSTCKTLYPGIKHGIRRRPDDNDVSSTSSEVKSSTQANEDHSTNQASSKIPIHPYSKYIINIGSNVDPIVPRDPCTRAVALEPIVADQIPPHPALDVIPAAVSATQRITRMQVYNQLGASSSLADAAHHRPWNQGDMHAAPRLVPVIDMTTVMDSFPNIQLIKTDMQGFDFTAFRSVGAERLASYQVPHLFTEVHLGGMSSYANTTNDLCLDWLPFMTRTGYVFEGLSVPRPGYENATALTDKCVQQYKRQKDKRTIGMNENDALWRLASLPATVNITETYFYPIHNQDGRPGLIFTEAEYAACEQNRG